METESEKYRNLISMLKKSSPEIGPEGEIERMVMRAIAKKSENRISFRSVIDFFFSWVDIVWIRRSLVAASAFLILFFVWQQGVIIKEVGYLNSRIIQSDANNIITGARPESQKLLFMKMSGQRLVTEKDKLSAQQIEALIKSYNELESKYSDLLKIINDDPELKILIEKKMTINNRSKTKL
jgi:hypothetical protein